MVTEHLGSSLSGNDALLLCHRGVQGRWVCVAPSPGAPVSPPPGGAPSQNSPSFSIPASLPAPSGFSSPHSSHRQPRCDLRSCPPPCTPWVLGTQFMGFDGSHPRTLVWELGPLLNPPVSSSAKWGGNVRLLGSCGTCIPWTCGVVAVGPCHWSRLLLQLPSPSQHPARS